MSIDAQVNFKYAGSRFWDSNPCDMAVVMLYRTGNPKWWSTGFRRLVDVVSFLKPLEGFFAGIDRLAKQTWGFYQVIESQK